MSLPTITFTEALIIEALVLTFTFYLLFRLSHRTFSFTVSKYLSSHSWISPLLYIVLITSFILTSVYSLYLGYRPNIYFILLSLFFVYIAFFNKGDSRVRNLSIIFIISILLPITVLANNNFYTFGETESVKALGIVETGNWKPVAKASYYELPILPVLLASIMTVTGFRSNSYIFVLPISSLLLALGLYLLSKQISNDERAASIAPFIFMSIPPLSFIPLISKYFSLILAFICLYLMIKLVYDKSRSNILILIPFLIAMVFSHATGPIFVLCLFLPLGIYSVITRNRSTIPHQFRSLSILTVVIMFTYWVFNQWVLLSVIGPTIDFFTTIVTYLSGSQLSVQEAARPYLESSTELTHVAFSWSVPPAIVTGFFIHRLQGIFIKRDLKKYSNWTHKITEIGSAVGLVFLLTSFLLAYYGTYSYSIIFTYALLAFLSILVVPKLLSSKNKFVTIVALSILVLSIFIGSSSPNWAPIENPDFPRRTTLYNQVASTSQFGQNLPKNVTLQLVLDFDVYLAISQNVYVERPRSYRETRRTLILLENGVPINELVDDYSTILIIRAERLKLQGENLFNLVMSSRKHVMVTSVNFLSDGE